MSGVRSGFSTGLEAEVCFETDLQGGQSEFLAAMFAAFAFAALLGLTSFHVVVCPCAALLFLGAVFAFAALMGWPSGFAVDSPAVHAALSDGFGAAMLAVHAVISDGYGAAMLTRLFFVFERMRVGSCAGNWVPGSSSRQLGVESEFDETVLESTFSSELCSGESEVGVMVSGSASELCSAESEVHVTVLEGSASELCPGESEVDVMVLEGSDPWASWPSTLDPWRYWRTGQSLPGIPEEPLLLGPDPEDPLFEWVACEYEDPSTQLYYDMLARLEECTVQYEESEAGSEIYFSGGLLEEEVPLNKPEPIKSIRILFRGPGGLGAWEVGKGEALKEWFERVGLSGGGSGLEGYFTTVGGKKLDPEVPIGTLGLVEGMEVVYQGRLRGGGYGGGGKGGGGSNRPVIPGEWTCTTCWAPRCWPVKTTCYQCGTARDGGAGSKGGGGGGTGAQGGGGVKGGARVIGPNGRNQVYVSAGDPTYRVNQQGRNVGGRGGVGVVGGGVGHVTPRGGEGVGVVGGAAAAGAPLPVGEVLPPRIGFSRRWRP